MKHERNRFSTASAVGRTVLCAFLLPVCFLSSKLCADIVVADNGASGCVISLAADAIPSERRAAETLRDYLEKISGARLEIRIDAENPAPGTLRIGPLERLGSPAPAVEREKLGPDGFALKEAEGVLHIIGGRPRGVLNGVHTLLEEKLGVRWFTPELEQVPQATRLVLPTLDETVVPALEIRDVFWTQFMRDADFAARHRVNGQHYGLREEHGGAFAVCFPFVHTFDALVPQELFAGHPEYFPLINGERKGGYVQRCLTNPDVLRITIARVKQWISEHPEARIFSVSQNDVINNCQCPECKALDDAEGSPAGSLLKFVNAVAEAVEKDHPQVRIDTLAYQYTRKAPRTLRPRHNVIVRLCSIECCFAHPLESCNTADNVGFRDDIVAWGKIAPSLYVWDYTTNFANYLQPFPNFDSLQDNVRFFVRHKVKSLFEQGNYSPGGGGEMEPLRAYLLAKLLWNPEADVSRHTDEFLAAYYGSAAPGMRAYLDAIHRSQRGRDLHARIFDPPTAAYLAPEVMDGAERMLDEAEKAAENETFRFRVQTARLPVWYQRIATNRVAEGEKAALVKRFLEIARKAGVSQIREGKPLDAWAREQGAE